MECDAPLQRPVCEAEGAACASCPAAPRSSVGNRRRNYLFLGAPGNARSEAPAAGTEGQDRDGFGGVLEIFSFVRSNSSYKHFYYQFKQN